MLLKQLVFIFVANSIKHLGKRQSYFSLFFFYYLFLFA